MTEPGKIIFREIDCPVPVGTEVLVRIRKIGICGSDIHVYHGKHPFTSYPITQGHEVSGEIAALGENAAGLTIGQHVTIEPQVVCGKCYPCRHGKYNLCEELKVMGFQTTGAGSEYFCTDQSKITPLPDSISLDQGAMIEPLAVAVHAVKQAGEIRAIRRIPLLGPIPGPLDPKAVANAHPTEVPGKKIAVLGAGPIGNLVAQTAMGMGAADVMITDVSDYRLELAAKVGIPHTVNTAKTDFGAALTDAFGPDHADIIYDCAGNNTTMGQAIKYARKGSLIILVAVFDGMATVDLAVLNDKELRLDTSMMYRHADYIQAIKLVQSGKVQLDPLISKHFDFKDFSDAYKFIDENRETTMKVIVNL